MFFFFGGGNGTRESDSNLKRMKLVLLPFDRRCFLSQRPAGQPYMMAYVTTTCNSHAISLLLDTLGIYLQTMFYQLPGCFVFGNDQLLLSGLGGNSSAKSLE